MLGAGAGVLTACAPGGGATWPGASPGATGLGADGTGGADASRDADADAAAGALMRLRAAWLARDRPAWVALFTPAQRRLGEVLVDNFALLDRVELGLVDQGAAAPEIEVRWWVGPDPRPAVHRLRVRVEGGLVAALTAAGPEALWARGPLTVARHEGGVVLAAHTVASGAVEAWVGATRVAVTRLASAELAPWASAWGGALVVERPGDAIQAAAVLGTTAPLGHTAALTVQPSAHEGPRVVVLPEAEQLGSADRVDLLVHEGVHAVSSSPLSRAPLWLVEGFAVSVAASTSPALAGRTQALHAAASASGVRQVPSQADLHGPQAEQAYARARFAHDACVAAFGRATVRGALADWDASGHPGEAALAEAYRASLS